MSAGRRRRTRPTRTLTSLPRDEATKITAGRRDEKLLVQVALLQVSRRASGRSSTSSSGVGFHNRARRSMTPRRSAQGSTERFAAGREAQQDGGRSPSFVVAEEHPVLAAARARPNGPLGEIVVDRQRRFFAVGNQSVPTRQGVAERLSQGTFGKYLSTEPPELRLSLSTDTPRRTASFRPSDIGGRRRPVALHRLVSQVPRGCSR
jgi:hypothetical protein